MELDETRLGQSKKWTKKDVVQKRQNVIMQFLNFTHNPLVWKKSKTMEKSPCVVLDEPKY